MWEKALITGGVFLGDDSVIIGGMQAAGGASTSNISNFYAMQCEAKEGCETEEMELEAIGAFEDSHVNCTSITQ